MGQAIVLVRYTRGQRNRRPMSTGKKRGNPHKTNAQKQRDQYLAVFDQLAEFPTYPNAHESIGVEDDRAKIGETVLDLFWKLIDVHNSGQQAELDRSQEKKLVGQK
jgi:hypothetical protein